MKQRATNALSLEERADRDIVFVADDIIATIWQEFAYPRVVGGRSRGDEGGWEGVISDVFFVGSPVLRPWIGLGAWAGSSDSTGW